MNNINIDVYTLIKPEINVFMDSRVPSTSIDEKIKKAPRMPS